MFVLHPRLAADTVPLLVWPLCHVLLMNDSAYPWLILVPARPDIGELHQLSAGDRAVLIEEIARAAEGLAETTGAHKINTAALGNVVPQLHVHVIARFRHDPAWPRPVWGVHPAVPYAESGLADLRSRLRRRLGGE
ncbi:MAG: HIT domain-containing protein [Alphaproteobacteria bacterium]|nr:HIT domain-containing protein [Alphaproteobacteria bacterium]MBF0130634.1 HIT domain-containing protein [Alphaproteobacteria bacterium]